jgi:hypothetical protein
MSLVRSSDPSLNVLIFPATATNPNRRIDARAQLHAGIELGFSSDHDAGMENAVAAGHDAVTQDGSELAPSGRAGLAADFEVDHPAVVAEVGEDRPRAKVDVGSEDGVAHVVEVRRLGAGQEDGALDLGVGSHDRAVPDPDAAAQVRSRADFYVLPQIERPFEHYAGAEPGSLADDDVVAGQVNAVRKGDLDRSAGQGREHLVERVAEEVPGSVRVEAGSKGRR